MKRCHRFLSFMLLLCWLVPAIAADATFGLEGGGSEGKTFQLDNSGIQRSFWIDGAKQTQKAAVSIDLTCTWPSRPQFSPCPSIPTANISYSATSLRTELDSNGFITYAPNNLVLQSNNFSSAAWNIQTNLSFASGVADPFGGNNAWTLTATLANARLVQSTGTAIQPQVNQIQTIWVRRRTGTGTVTFEALGVGVGTTITPTSTWQKFVQTGSANSSAIIAGIRINTAGDAIDVYEFTSSVVTYETSPRLGDQVITTSSAYYGPAFDSNYPSAGYQGLRIEEQRTNLALNNTAMAGASWTTFTQGGSGTVSRTANDGTAPDGSNNATLVTVNRTTTTDGAGVFQTYTGTAANYTGTFYLKAFGAGDVGKQISLSAYDGTSATATSQLILTASWKPYSITHLTTASATANFSVGYVANAGSQTGTVNFLVYYGQFELGPNATSVIPTGASAVARSADIVQATGTLATCYKAASMSAVAEFIFTNPVSNGGPNVISTTGTNRILYVNSSSHVASFDSGATPNSLNSATTVSAGQTIRAALSRYPSGRAVVGMGGNVAQDNQDIASGATVYVGSQSGTNVFIDGYLRKIACWSPALPNSILQQKSVVGPGPITWLIPANENFAIDERRKAA